MTCFDACMSVVRAKTTVGKGVLIMKKSLDSYNSAATLAVNSQNFRIYGINAVELAGVGEVSKLPRTLKILLENLLRNEDGDTVTTDDILAFGDWIEQRTSTREIAFRPGRVLMQDLPACLPLPIWQP